MNEPSRNEMDVATAAALITPVFFSHLNSTEQQRISEVCTGVERTANGGVPHLERLILNTEPRLQLALLEQLLPVEIDHLKQSRGQTPTLHELTELYPKLGELLEAAYPRIDARWRLPVLLGDYELIRLVDAGSQAAVGIGEHKNVGGRVALKFSNDEESSRRLIREARFLSRLRGLHVPKVIDGNRTPDGTTYVVMELLEGRKLFDLASSQAGIGEPVQAARYLLQIADTVAQIHKRGVVHRDLSPKNIVLGHDGALMIIDFGLAIDDSIAFVSTTQVVEFQGTPAFQAPEQMAGDGTVDPKLGDVYTLGRLLLFMVNGLDAIIKSMGATQDQQKPLALPDRDLNQIYATATHADPARRYQTVDELVLALQRYLKRIAIRSKLARAGALLGVSAAIIAIVVSLRGPEPQSNSESNSRTLGMATGPSWIELLADDQGLDLGTIDESSFTLRYEHGDPMYFTEDFIPADAIPRYHGKIHVDIDENLADFMIGMQVRFGNHPWQPILKGLGNLEYYILVEERDVERDVPVELRIYASPTVAAEERIIGPFQYDLELFNAIQADRQSEIDRLAAMNWIAYTNGSWTIGNMIHAGSDVIEELRIGTSPDEVNRAIPIRDHYDPIVASAESLPPIEEFVPTPLHETPFYHIYEDFNRHLEALEDPFRLYAQLKFADGSLTEVREFNIEVEGPEYTTAFIHVSFGTWRIALMPKRHWKTLLLGTSADSLTRRISLQNIAGETSPWEFPPLSPLHQPMRVAQLNQSAWISIEERIHRQFTDAVVDFGDPDTLYAQLLFDGGQKTEVLMFSR